jgi:hypothetical protein
MVLTRHFFTSMFGCGFLSVDGAESFKRLLLGCAAVALGIGLLLVRVFMGKYAGLSAGPADGYQLALAADHAFLIAVPMWIVAAAVVLTGDSLFPDQTDYRILMAEPLRRQVIFGAKLASLLLFIGLFVVGAHAALLPLVLLTMLGQPGPGAVVAHSAAFALSSGAASLCAALTIVGVHGVLVLCAPRSRFQAVAAVTKAGLMAALVLSVPLLIRLPGTAAAFAADSWWLRWAPPVWFLGLERWLVGDVARGALAVQAISATLGALTVSSASYVVLYRRFDSVTLRPAACHTPILPARWRAPATTRRPVRLAIREFTSITLRRSPLHQGIVVAALAAAAGFVVNGALLVGVPSPGAVERPDGALPWITVWAPMTLIFVAVPAVRLALSLPIDLRANWVFRMTDDEAIRVDPIAAGVRMVLAVGVALPIALVAPLQWWLLGWRTLQLALLEGLFGWLLVEVLMREWRRIPFTCTYIPGKGFVPHMFVKGILAYLLFTSVADAVLQRSSTSAPATAVAVLVLGALAWVLAGSRKRQATMGTLIFEDELPADIIPLRLGGD